MHLNKEPIIEYITSNITMLKWMIATGYSDVRTIQRRIAAMAAWPAGPHLPQAAADAAGVQAHEVLHVGDDAALDVLAALGCGMQTVWVNRADHLWAHDAEPHETVTTLTELCDLFPS